VGPLPRGEGTAEGGIFFEMLYVSFYDPYFWVLRDPPPPGVPPTPPGWVSASPPFPPGFKTKPGGMEVISMTRILHFFFIEHFIVFFLLIPQMK